MRVVHRAFLDGAALDVRDLKIGAERALQLEPFEANPQVASLFVAEMDDFTWTGPTWFDVGPVTHAAPDDKIRQRD